MALTDNLSAIGNAIREKNGTTDLIPLVDMPQAILDLSGGGTEEIENLIDESGVLEDTEGSVSEKVEQLIDKAEEADLWYENFKTARGWNRSAIFENYTGVKLPKIDVSNYTSMGYFCNGASKLESIDFYLDCKNAASFDYAFQYCSSLKRMKGINTSSAIILNRLFYGCNALEEIEEPLDFTNVTNTHQAFLMGNLKEICIIKETIKISISFADSYLLSAESIQSIIDGLATVETAQTLTLNSAITLTDEQKATINSKGWTLAQ